MPAAFDRHISEDALERYSLGILAEMEVPPLEEHLLICPSCQDRLAQMDSFVRATQRAARKLRGERPPGWWIAAPAWAAGLAVAAIVLFLVARSGLLRQATGSPAVAVFLRSARGPDDLGIQRAPAGRPLRLSWDASEWPSLPSYRVQVVNSSGRLLLESAADSRQGRPSILLREALPRGKYWIRLYGPSSQGELLREFGLELE